MSKTREEIRQRAWQAILSRSFFSAESAIIIAMSIVLFGLGFQPFDWWQPAFWLLFGTIAEAGREKIIGLDREVVDAGPRAQGPKGDVTIENEEAPEHGGHVGRERGRSSIGTSVARHLAGSIQSDDGDAILPQGNAPGRGPKGSTHRLVVGSAVAPQEGHGPFVQR